MIPDTKNKQWKQKGFLYAIFHIDVAGHMLT